MVGVHGEVEVEEAALCEMCACGGAGGSGELGVHHGEAGAEMDNGEAEAEAISRPEG